MSVFAQVPSGAKFEFLFANGSLNNTAGGATAATNLTESTSGALSIPDRSVNADNAYQMNSGVFINTRAGENTARREIGVSFWIKTTASQLASSGNTQVMLIDGPEGFLNPRFNNTTANGLRFGFGAQGSDSNGQRRTVGGLTGTPNIADNQWHNVVITSFINNNTIEFRMYIDGVQAGIGTPTITNVISSAPPTFLRDPRVIVSPQSQFSGEIDDIRYYQRSLSATDAANLAAENPPAPTRTIVYVDASATGLNDGTTWADAFTTLQTALSSTSSTDDVWVAAGNYSPGTATTDSFLINSSNIRIYGGFNGTETALEQRDFSTNVTTLNGDVLNDDTGVAYSGANRDDNNTNVVTISGNNVTIDGFVIANGQADDTTSGETQEGSAISIQAGNITISNCIIENNVVTRGGAVRMIDRAGSLDIENSIFRNNLGVFGVCLYTRASNTNTLDVNISNSLFENNTLQTLSGGTGNAGIIWFRNDFGTQNVVLTNNTFANNRNLRKGVGATLINANRINGTVNISVLNSIIHGNRNADGLTMISVGNDAGSQNPNSIIVSNSIGEDAAFSNIIDNGGNRRNISNSSADPLFTSISDFTLQSASPAINAGNDTFAVGNRDLIGNQRINGSAVDMGAYEFGATAGIEENSKLEFVLYPNPASNVLNVVSDLAFAKAEIYNLQGQRVITSNEAAIQVADLKTGMYIIKIVTEDGATATQQFIKK
ncbi:fibronectin type III domain protein [Nonlabens dokdonensis DSW-6]|uniref:Fibronectin type III domain protein n=2 Tax=Nonlabens dokdonensis TaxID=328515 RepID=L7W5Y7_NONDD|nr:fibronectin type III domain protein [Nonlabens dokdonensis DSW-6]